MEQDDSTRGLFCTASGSQAGETLGTRCQQENDRAGRSAVKELKKGSAETALITAQVNGDLECTLWKLIFLLNIPKETTMFSAV